MPVEIRKRDMKLSDHNISRDKYNELKYFCLQYWQKKQEIDRNYGIDGFSQDGMPRGTSSSWQPLISISVSGELPPH